MRVSAKILRGLVYTLASGYVARAASVALTFAIRRELGPSVFADVVLGATIFMLLSSLREFGLPHALLHYQEHAAELAGTHFFLNLALTSASAAITCTAAVGLRWWLPDLVSHTAVTVVFAFTALAWLRNLVLTSESLLRMEFEFGRLSLLHGAGTILALTAAYWAARSGWGHWSLLLGGWSTFSVFSAVYVLVFSLGVWRGRPISLSELRLSWTWTRRLVDYGKWIWVGWILQTFVWWFDKVVVWSGYGGQELALYENAWWLVQLPTAVITAIIFTYTNSVYSRFQGDRAKLSQLYTHLTSLIVRVSSPLALVLVLCSHQLLSLMPGWGASAQIVVWLAGYAFLRPLIDDGLGLLWAVGSTRLSTAVMAVQAGVAVLAVPLAGHLVGVRGVALSMGMVSLVGIVALALALRRHVDVAWGRVLAAPVLALGVAAAAVLWLGPRAGDRPAAGLVISSAIVALAYGASLLLLERRYLVTTLRSALNVARQTIADGG